MRYVFIVLAALALSGCASSVQEAAVDTALQEHVQDQQEGDGQTAPDVPTTMPPEFLIENGSVTLSTEVADGYQLGYDIGLSLEDVLEYIRALDGWGQVAEFETGDTQSISVERDDQRVLVTITSEGSRRSRVLVTGSFVTE